MVQEERFYRYCNRQKNIIVNPYDEEFKLFVKNKGYKIDLNSFEVEFNESSQINKMTELDIQQRELSNYSQAVGVPGMSKRFAMKKYLGLTEEEYEENRVMYMQENPTKLQGKDVKIPQVNNKQIPGLRSISASEIDDEVIQSIQDAFAEEQSGGQQGGGLGGGGLGGGLGADLGGGTPDLGADMGGAEEAPAPEGE